MPGHINWLHNVGFFYPFQKKLRAWKTQEISDPKITLKGHFEKKKLSVLDFLESTWFFI